MTSHGSSVSVPTPTGSQAGPEAASAAKKRRINFACNYCRNRKTRCDEQKPSCRACIVAGIECITTDRRRPGIQVQRRETKRRMSRTSTSSLTQSLAADNASPRSPRGTEAVEPAAAPAARSSPWEIRRDDGDRGPAAPAREPVRVVHEPEAKPSQSPPAKYQGKLPVVRASRGSNSVEILGDWLDLAARRLGILQRCGLPSSAAKPPPNQIRVLLSSDPLPFPCKDAAHQLASSYLDGVNIVYPLVNRDRFRQDLDAALGNGPTSFAEARGVAALSTVYLVLAVGFASEALSELPPDARDYLSYCKTLLGHLVVSNNVDNARAIVLLALCLHGYDDCAAAWNTLGVGVSMAVSLGLHKPRTCRGSGRDRPDRTDDFVDEEERRRFWLAIYAFEKLLAFEMGRLSTIDDDEDCYAPRVAMPTGNNGTASKEKAFSVTVDLARILSEIGRKAVIISRKEDGLGDGLVQSVIAEKVQTLGETQLLLTRWGESVPEELRPISDMLIGSKVCPFASFVSMHYNNALIILSRNSLLISEEVITISADILAKGKPWDYILRNGQSIAANSARKVLRIFVEAVDCRSNTILPNLLAPLHALSALAMHVVTHPGSRISTMDLQSELTAEFPQLIQTCSDSLREMYARIRGDDMLNLLLQKLDMLLQKGTQPPPGSDSQRVNAITAHTPRSEPGSWHPAGETPAQRAAEAPWAGSGENRPREDGSHMAQPTMPFFGQGHVAAGRNDAGFDSFGAMPMVGDEWSPSLSDGIGWDWASFSQLLTEQYHMRVPP
ncbi:fungal specific transcription factor domain-containing protein [Colletotrichum graminicola]|uniref:Fungal specific transcription factor domain-containing protein n=1 Tax=Colletotrichum graminicola (strain M1.001 / M2 / FGSC 10212) TaxID=645133 RepID=E3QHI1_COLGM|nr:fungal specific transcription factor domain-containing protein [Colletotrichum graminicola M1.001]EFQ30152.1 fungal specific transcription factor domain-containing protein [Colletotrichum graminicola M1.001]WDK09192.1 fungal specific transcription factor domain-containing protein [Colletotrichum graminicola]